MQFLYNSIDFQSCWMVPNIDMGMHICIYYILEGYNFSNPGYLANKDRN